MRWRTIRHASLVLLALVAAHEAIYWSEGQTTLVPDDGAHAYWPVLLAITAISTVVLAAWSTWRIGRSVLAFASPASAPATFLTEWRAIVRGLVPAVTVTYLVLENVEHLFAHGHLEGIDVFLMPGQLLSFPILLAVVAVVGALGALARWQESVIAYARSNRRSAARSTRPAGTRLIWFQTADIARNARLLFFEDLGRAPPITSV